MSGNNNEVMAVLKEIMSRLDAIEAKVGRGGRGASSDGDDEIPDVVVEYDSFLEEHVKPLVGIASGDEELTSLMQYYSDAMAQSRRILLAMFRSAKPNDQTLAAFIAPLGALIEKVNDIPRKANFVNMWKAMSEAVQVAGWPLQPGPHNMVQAQIGSMEFYSNRARTQYNNATVVNLIVAIRKGLNALGEFCKENFKAGVSWTGSAALENFSDGAAALKAAPAAAPAPAPAQPAQPAPAKDKPAAKAQPAGKTYPAKSLTERGNRVVFTGYCDEPEVTVYNCQKDQFVVISKCHDAVFQLTGKANAVRFDSCRNVTVVVDTIVSCFEASNNETCRVQINERVPTFQIDSCTGLQTYLTKAAAAFDPHFVSAKSTSMLIGVLPGEEDGDDADVTEYGIPEQLLTRIVDGKLLSVPAESLDQRPTHGRAYCFSSTMLHAQHPSAQFFRRLIDSIKELVSVCNIACSETGISITAMDSCSCALVQMTLEKTSFLHYSCQTPLTLGVSVEVLSKILRVAGSVDTIQLDTGDDNDRLTIHIEDHDHGRRAGFNIRLMDVDETNVQAPDSQDAEATIEMPSGEFARVIRDFSNLGEEIEIKADKTGVTFTVAGDTTSGDLQINAGTTQGGETISVNAKTSVSTSYPIRYLQKICKAMSLSDRVTMSFSSQQPILLSYPLCDESSNDIGSINYYLAPKVNQDNDDVDAE